jgi:hypothetical protein
MIMLAVGIFGGAAPTTALSATTIYDSTLSPLPPNLPSLGFECCSIKEVGDDIQFAGTDRIASQAIVTMSDWAKHADFPSMPADGWTHQITLNVYAADHTGSDPAAGARLATVTQEFQIPWRPADDLVNCPLPDHAWFSGDTCYHGIAFNITFDLSALNLTLPNEIIYGIAYNTNTEGYFPIGLPGPYDSLNVGLNTVAGPTVGVDLEPDVLFCAGSNAANDCNAAGGLFGRATGWSGYIPAVRFTATPSLVGPPVSKDQCKKDVWKTFNNPTFKNEGDCLSYTNNGK